MIFRYSHTAVCLAALTALPAIAHAQDTPADSEVSRPDSTDDPHGDHGDPIVVIGHAGVRSDFLSGVDQLDAAELVDARRPTIGDTLAKSPGVSASSFGPSASRPILRGLQGERVRILTDGIGSIDASSTSVDHAVVIDPLLADRVEILRGPQSLLYGSASVGGVVNVVEKRIPRRVPSEGVHVDALVGYGSAANERSAAATSDIALSDRFVAHVDGSYTRTDDLRIGGYALAPSARAEALASALLPPDPVDPIDFAGNAAIRDRLPNSASESWTAGIAGAFIDSGGNIGVAYSHYDSLYGVPLRYATLPGQEQEGPRLNLVQDRFDARAEVTVGGGLIDRIALRYAYADYRHQELDESGAIGTTFFNQGMEGRIEFAQAARGAWSGTTGAQYLTRDFDVVGAEAFLPKNTVSNLGLFSVQQIDWSPLKIEAAARFEHVVLVATPSPAQPQFFAGRRAFDTWSAALGGAYDIGGGWRIGANVSRNERAPSAEELFPNGPHAGTQSFEVGDSDLASEKSWSVEALIGGDSGDVSVQLSAFHTWFDDFVYESRTGAIEDGLPVYAFDQGKARFYGAEAQAEATLARVGEGRIAADILADVVRATIEGVGPAPRIPPLRVLGGIGYKGPRFDLRGEIEWVDRQTRVAALETPTDGYTVVNFEAGWRPWGEATPLSLSLSANNIFDVDARRHASFLKDFAPLAGRDIRLTARISI